MGYKYSDRIKPKASKSKYKTIYLDEKKIDHLEEIAQKRNTSFNGVVADMIDYCLENLEEDE